MSSLRNRDFLTVADLTKDEIMDILTLALEVKKIRFSKELEGKTLACSSPRPVPGLGSPSRSL